MRVSRLAVVASLTLSALSCGGSGGSTSSGAGKITVLLKDKPGDIQAAVVTIAEMDLVGAAGSAVLMTTPVTTDLLTLASKVQALVQGAAIPAGAYSQLRFVITGGYIEAGGAIYATAADYAGLPAGATVAGELRLPSEARSGLKVILPEGFQVGADSVLVVDFDVSQSFHPAGNSGAWLMRPTVKASVPEATGTVAVTLHQYTEAPLPPGCALADFKAVLIPAGATDGPVAALTPLDKVDKVGATYQFVTPGDYTVTFLAPPGIEFSTYPDVPAQVTVVAGQTVTAQFNLTRVTTAPQP